MKSKEDFVGFDKHEYAPIVRSESMKLLLNLLKENNPKNILEIGTFIGYSASAMLEACSDCFVSTLEINEKNVVDARENLLKLGFKNRFEVVHCDAIDYLQKFHDQKQFDLIFLDGPKGQYFKYFPYLKEMLKSGGILVADDILFYGMVRSTDKIDHKHRALVNNLRKFLDLLAEDKDFETTIYEFDNGMSVSVKK